MMEAMAAAVATLAFSPASSSCCSSSSSFPPRALNCAHAARWRSLESSCSLYFLPAGGAQLAGLKFADTRHTGRATVRSLRVRSDAGISGVKERVGEDERWRLAQDFTTVMKFGGSSVASAHRMREVAQLILSFPDERPVIVLSAMGKTTNNLLKAGEKAVTCGVESGKIEELQVVKDLHKTYSSPGYFFHTSGLAFVSAESA